MYYRSKTSIHTDTFLLENFIEDPTALMFAFKRTAHYGLEQQPRMCIFFPTLLQFDQTFR